MIKAIKERKKIRNFFFVNSNGNGLDTKMSRFIFLIIFSISTHQAWTNDGLLEAISQLGVKGSGNENLVKHWPAVKKMSSADIPSLLIAMNKANDLGDNWARAAIFEILESSGKESLPEEEVVKFIKDQQNDGSSRRTAFDFLFSASPQVAESLIPTFIDDPEITLRREGVQLLLNQASELENEDQAIEAYEYALGKARDVDQIEAACESLKGLGKEIDLAKRMGFLTAWKVIGPFDNIARNGFNIPYSPEKAADPLQTRHAGKEGPVQWQTFSTSDDLGLLDLNQPFGHIKEVLCYAYAEFNSSEQQNVQFRIGSKNAWKLWINNQLIFARDEYHRGATRVDQFILGGTLQKGTNRILVKVCQNEQTESWTKQWEFCFRITDLSGTTINPVN